MKKEKLLVIRAVLLRIIDRRREQQHSSFVDEDSVLNEDGLPIAKRTRRSSSPSSSSSSSCVIKEEFPTTAGRLSTSHSSLRLKGIDPAYNPRSLDDIQRVVRSRKADNIVYAAKFQGYCPRHGTYNKDIVLRDHNHDTEILACYCHDDSSAITFDNVVSEVSYELGIATDTLNYWVIFSFSPNTENINY